MKYILLALPLLISTAFARTSNSVIEEMIYLEFKNEIQSGLVNKKLLGFTEYEQSLVVDAITDSLNENPNIQTTESLRNIQSIHFSLVEKLRLALLKITYDGATSIETELTNEIMSTLVNPQVDVRLIYVIAANENILLKVGSSNIIDLAKTHSEYSNIDERGDQVLPNIITDLYFNTPDTSKYMDGEYANSVKIFMFCHNDRLYPCLMVMRDINNKDVRNSDGTLWTHQALASAVTGLPPYQRNGSTPAGIFTIDSVMPTADQQISYGKFRRLILNFVPKSKDEVLMKTLLPKSSWNHDWWNQTVIARDIGRNMFRIHGSGKINTDPNTPFYPFNRTHGCISQRENKYDGVTYQDQRNLLDDIMKAMNMKPQFTNEPKIKGILYIIELDDTNGATTVEELKNLGIQ